MTVQQLLDMLESIEDKSIQIYYDNFSMAMCYMDPGLIQIIHEKGGEKHALITEKEQKEYNEDFNNVVTSIEITED